MVGVTFINGLEVIASAKDLLAAAVAD